MYKIIIPSLTLLFLCNCYTYNESLNQNYEIGKHYKIITADKKTLKAQLLSEKGDSLVISGYKSALTIAKKDIIQLDRRNFSYEKTIGLPILIVGILTLLGIYSVNNTKFLSK